MKFIRRCMRQNRQSPCPGHILTYCTLLRHCGHLISLFQISHLYIIYNLIIREDREQNYLLTNRWAGKNHTYLYPYNINIMINGYQSQRKFPKGSPYEVLGHTKPLQILQSIGTQKCRKATLVEVSGNGRQSQAIPSTLKL